MPATVSSRRFPYEVKLLNAVNAVGRLLVSSHLLLLCCCSCMVWCPSEGVANTLHKCYPATLFEG